MNERIKELFKRAGGKTSIRNLMSNPVQHREYNELWDEHIEKFAELIVREFIKELRYEVLDTQECRHATSTDYKVGWEDGMFDAGETIKKHFGVEE